jgi:hypothetical protein
MSRKIIVATVLGLSLSLPAFAARARHEKSQPAPGEVTIAQTVVSATKKFILRALENWPTLPKP